MNPSIFFVVTGFAKFRAHFFDYEVFWRFYSECLKKITILFYFVFNYIYKKNFILNNIK